MLDLRHRSRLSVGILGLLLVGFACTDQGPVPVESFTAHVTCQTVEPTAAIIEIADARVREIRESEGRLLQFERDGIRRAAVASLSSAEPSFVLRMEDTGAPPVIRVVEAVDERNELVPNPDRCGLEVSR